MITKRECRCKHCETKFIDKKQEEFPFTRYQLLNELKDAEKEPDSEVIIHECSDGYIGFCEITAMVLEE